MGQFCARLSLILGLVILAAPSADGESPQAAKKSAAVIDATVFRDIAERQNPAVVSVMARSWSRSWSPEEADLFRLFGIAPPEPRAHMERITGSGFLITAGGEILTNYHVVEGAQTIEVTLFGNDRKRYRAVLVGGDPVTDSALLRLENPPPDLQSATLGDSSTLAPGDWVMAIGNPFQLGHTVTVGFVSFQGRAFSMPEGISQDLIQTDASINPGNSGGPLINIHGEVVGVNVGILDGDTGGNIGIGFAVPINTVVGLLPQLRRGKVVRGQLGAEFHKGPILEDEAVQLGLPNAAGALVRTVDTTSTAARAGLRAGDVVVELDGGSIADTRELLARVQTISPGTEVVLKVFRRGARQTRRVTIDPMPMAAPRGDIDAGTAADFDGLTLSEFTAATAKRLSVPRGVDGALVAAVALDSPADEASLAVGDVIRAVNGARVHGPTEAREKLRRVEPRTPIFLLVWRDGVELFLEMRKD
jgi:serine protease Do